jgi:hypothetical protein
MKPCCWDIYEAEEDARISQTDLRQRKVTCQWATAKIVTATSSLRPCDLRIPSKFSANISLAYSCIFSAIRDDIHAINGSRLQLMLLGLVRIGSRRAMCRLLHSALLESWFTLHKDERLVTVYGPEETFTRRKLVGKLASVSGTLRSLLSRPSPLR